MCFHILYFSYTFLFYILSILFHVFIFHSITYCFSCSITYSFIYFCTFIYFLYFSCVHLSFYNLLLFITGFVSYTFHINLYFTSCSCNCILSSNSNIMLLISYHMIYFAYTFPLCILFIFFYIHVCKYLRSGYGK